MRSLSATARGRDRSRAHSAQADPSGDLGHPRVECAEEEIGVCRVAEVERGGEVGRVERAASAELKCVADHHCDLLIEGFDRHFLEGRVEPPLSASARRLGDAGLRQTPQHRAALHLQKRRAHPFALLMPKVSGAVRVRVAHKEREQDARIEISRHASEAIGATLSQELLYVTRERVLRRLEPRTLPPGER